MRIQNYINGKFVDPIGNGWLDNYEPARGVVYSEIPDSTEGDVARAIDAAEGAFESWSKLSLEKRHGYLMKISTLIDERRDEFAAAESRDNGKPLTLATNVDIPRASSNFRFYATAAMQFASESHPMAGHAITISADENKSIINPPAFI